MAKPKVNIRQIFEFKELDVKTQRHLVKVYSTLAVTLFAAFLGALVSMWLQIAARLSALLGVGAMVWIGVGRNSLTDTFRMGLLVTFGFLEGYSLGPLLSYAADIDSGIILNSLLGTTMVFICFTCSALSARQGQMLYLRGVLSSALSVCVVLSVGSLFCRSPLVHTVNLYLTLLVFCGHVLYDTQMIVAKLKAGDEDFVWHAVELFTDFIGIFVNLVTILSKDKKKNKK